MKGYKSTAPGVISLLVMVGLLVFPMSASAGIAVGCASVQKHCTDGGFNLHNGGSQTTDSTEWAGGNVVKTEFPFNPSDGSGGSFLYVEQGAAGDNTLYLMYDYVASQAGLNQSNSFFDVFFQVAPDDYLVRIMNNAILLTLEKPSGTTSSLNPDGSFNTGAPWQPMSSSDVNEAQFVGAVGFGPSPNSASNHLMAEFELSINRPAQPGFYDPAPAFWSTSVDCAGTCPDGVFDPPISSAIFTLNPDGTTLVAPIFSDPSSGSGAIKQPASAVPEPASLLLLGSGLAGVALWRRSKHV